MIHWKPFCSVLYSGRRALFIQVHFIGREHDFVEENAYDGDEHADDGEGEASEDEASGPGPGAGQG